MMAKKPAPKLTAEALKHDAATRKNILIAEIGEAAVAVIDGDITCPFDKPSKVGAGDTAASAVVSGGVFRLVDRRKSGRIAVKVINHLGDEVMKVFKTG